MGPTEPLFSESLGGLGRETSLHRGPSCIYGDLHFHHCHETTLLAPCRGEAHAQKRRSWSPAWVLNLPPACGPLIARRE